MGLAFVAGFPAFLGGCIAIARWIEPTTATPGEPPVGQVLLALAAVLLLLGLRSFLRVEDEAITVRFYGLRSTTLRLDELAAATFVMAFPSISYAISLTDQRGRKALVHANWWRDESIAMLAVSRALVQHDVPMDRSTARIVARVLRIKRPKARIIHHALLRKDKTW